MEKLSIVSGEFASPLMANVFLHYVLDEWFEKDVKPRLKGYGFMARYCDDFVMGFQREEDARRIYEVLPKRLARFGLTMHPEKSRIVDFRPPPYRISRTNLKGYERDVRKIQSFDFLGFSHTWRKSLKGNWVVFRGTMKSRLDRGLASVSLWCKRHRHAPLASSQPFAAVSLRSLCLLWYTRELPQHKAVLPGGHQNLEKVAHEEDAKTPDQLGGVQPIVEALPVTHTKD